MPDRPPLETAIESSRWCARTARARPEWLPRIRALAGAPLDADVLGSLLQTERGGESYKDSTHLASVLRRTRNKTLFALIERDLSGSADLREVMAAMTALAELAIREALEFSTRELALIHGVPVAASSGKPQDLIVVGMGKLGGGELNVSSDIDLIFLYGESGETASPDETPVRPVSNHEFFDLLGRRLIAILSEATADGFVFRVDMGLRPNGSSGPLAASFTMLEEYFITQGRDWERFAWIKARIVSRPVLSGISAAEWAGQMEAIDRPFVYRRYLDFGAIAALRALHGQIRVEVVRQETKAARNVSGDASAYRPINVKLGRGGVREIEFIVQLFQLIRGGRDADLRDRSTLAMLSRLVQKGLVDAGTSDRLASAYVFLRNVEHRLQYVDDAQTHVLPRDPEVRERVAAMCTPYLEGASSTGTGTGTSGLLQALEEKITVEQAFVADVFDEVFGARKTAADSSAIEGEASLWSDALIAHEVPEISRAALNSLGYSDAESAWARLRALWTGSKLRAQAASSRERIDKLVPLAIRMAGRFPNSVATLGRLLDLFEAIAGRSSYLAFLTEFPQALERVARVLAASPWAARYLKQHPLLLDELLDAEDHALPDRTELARALDADLARARGDAERRMDILRETHHAQVFRLLTQDLEGRLSVEALSDHLSALADLIVAAAVNVGWEQLPQRHREQPRFAVIAYGKLGGKELGYASDLDLIFLFDDEHERAAENYARLAQRLVTILTTRTTAGTLFEVDLALRPDGSSGLLVASLAAYRKYEMESAWVWEHQALTRARFCAGDLDLGRVFEQLRRDVLSRPREPADLRQEVLAMRKKMSDAQIAGDRGSRARRAAQPAFDLKNDPGGMIDIEFATQYLVLGYAHAHPQLLDDVGNIALLLRAAAAGLIDAELALSVGDAYRAYRKRQHALRLAESAGDVSGAAAGAGARVGADEFIEERKAVRTLWSALFGE